MATYSGKGYTTQTLTVHLEFNSDFKVLKDWADDINYQLSELIAQCVIDGEIDDIDYGDYVFDSSEDEFFEKGDEFDFELDAKVVLRGTYTYYPAVPYLSNGDPGDPEEVDWEPEEGWIEKFDEKKFSDKVHSIPHIGPHIDFLSIYIDDPDDDYDVEIEEEDWY